MITGQIEHSRYPRIWLDVVTNGKRKKFKFLIDTGFDDEVALFYDDADRLDLEIIDYVLVSYANGESVEELIAEGKVDWFGEEREVVVILSNDEEPAIGTKLLKDCLMTMDFARDTLTIEKQS